MMTKQKMTILTYSDNGDCYDKNVQSSPKVIVIEKFVEKSVLKYL